MSVVSFESLNDVLSAGAGVESAELNGIVTDMPPHIYHSRPEISAHGLHKIARCPAMFLHGLRNPHTPTPAQRWGTLVHLRALEPGRFADEVACTPPHMPERPQARSVNAKNPRPEVIAAATAWARFDAENIGKEMVDAAELGKLSAVQAALMAHPSAGRLLLAGGHTEASMFWQDPDTGLRCRARTDRIHASDQFILDVKTTKDASAEAFSRDAWSYRYDVQAAFYLDGYRAITGIDGKFIFVCVENDAPHLVACYVATPEMIEAGRARYRRDLATYAACVESGQWPGYGDAVLPLDLPVWASKSLNQ